MANWEWPSIADKLEAIGYLAVPGVISSIEATVPKGKTKQFREEYTNSYSEEYPYEADKYGRQFRIYLNDTEGCPDFLRNHLDGKYGNRINNTQFIDELVKEYGFKFTKAPQDANFIRNKVFSKHTASELNAFRKGFNGYREFVHHIEELVKTENSLSNPNALGYKERTISRLSERKSENSEERLVSGFTPNQMLRLGWVGEEYIAYLLKIRDETLLGELSIPKDSNYKVEWFNEGVQNASEEYLVINNWKEYPFMEIVKRWDDKSIGKGCDIVVTLDVGNVIYIEVKTSKRSYPYFNMTSVEMQEMEMQREKYVLVKINNFERLLKKESPDIIVITNPFEKLFHPKQMKEAIFIVGEKNNEC